MISPAFNRPAWFWLFAGFWLATTALHAGPSRAEQPLPSAGWRVQPASAPEQAPGPAGWSAPGAKTPGAADSLWYAQTFSCPAEWADGRRVFLDFERTEGDSIVFLNGRRVAELLAPGGEIELTAAVAFGRDNELTVFNTRAYTGISRTFEQDWLRHAVRTGREGIPMKDWPRGITAPVTLRSRPTQAVTDVFVVPSWRKKTLGLEVEVDSAAATADGVLEAVIRDAEGKAVLSFRSGPLALPAGRSVQRLAAAWADPIPWELDQAYLYRAELRLHRGGVLTDQAPAVSFGFREIWTEGRELRLNGHPMRWRLTDLYGASANALSFYRLMGYNAGQIQPHAKLWWHTWNDTPLLDEQLIAEADRLGFALTVPAPSVTNLGPALLADAGLRRAYEDELRRFTRKYRNHPSILAWAVGMNSYNPVANIQPETMGRREAAPAERGRVAARAVEIARAADPTRLAFSHADGSLGDISSANVYLNFAPLQEREEWPMAWARGGDMPYSAVEFGQPFTANFWKGKQFLLTEYLAIYFGEQAYERETAAGLAAVTGLGLANKRGFGAWSKVDASAFPGYWDFQDLFVNRTNRAWRTWGVNAGWLHWLLDVGYGNPSAAPGDTGFMTRYKKLPAPLTERPAWANPNFEIHRKSNLPFLAYLAGGGVHTDRTHAFYAGERFEKQVALVWDGATPKPITVTWTLTAGETIAEHGSKELTLAPGQIAFVPLALTAPKADAVLALRVTEDGREIATDAFAIQGFEKPVSLGALATRVAVFDPAEKSGSWLRGLGLKPAVWRAGETLAGIDVLVIGREALKPGDTLPYTAQDIARGLRVLILEQQPAVWEMLGFETIETLPRLTFAADRQGPILAGLKPADLVDWRGSPDLLPEGRQVRTYDNQRAPRWTNRHAVASVVLKIPEVVGFTPILKTEFDLAYSPLLEWRHGRGAVYFNSLDLTGRVGVDPAATRLAGNLLRALATPPPATRPVYYRGEAAGETLLRALQVAPKPGAPAPGTDALWVLGDALPGGSDVAAFVENGGTVLRLPQPAQALRSAGFAVEERSVARISGAVSSVLRGVGADLLRWREALPVAAFADGDGVLAGGILREQAKGGGREVWLQVSPDLLAHRYLDEPEKRESLQLSVARLQRLTAQVLTNLGAAPSSALADRVCHLGRISTYQPIGSWHVLGPWKSRQTGAKALLAETWPGEAEAIAGDDNPNTVYRRDDGVALDWRKVVNAGEAGFVDLGTELQAGEGSVVYAQRKISSEKNRMVRMRLGADYWLRFWVNGRLLLEVAEGHAAPKPAAFQVDVPLRAGENVLTVKAAAGSKGFGFWADFGDLGGGTEAGGGGDAAKAAYYLRLFKPFDPYQFHYW